MPQTTRRTWNRIARFEVLEDRSMMSASALVDVAAGGHAAHVDVELPPADGVFATVWHAVSAPLRGVANVGEKIAQTLEKVPGVDHVVRVARTTLNGNPVVQAYRRLNEVAQLEDAPKINVNDLRPGDVILCNGSMTAMRFAIKAVSSSGFTHAAIYVGKGRIVDATDCYGISRRKIETLYPGQNSVYVLRMANLTEAQRESIAKAAEKFVSGGYSKASAGGGGVLGQVPGKDTNASDKMCSELVWDAYYNALKGTRVTPGNLPTPGDLARSDCFSVAGRLA